MTDKAATILVYRIVIKASAQAIWDAITKPEWTERYAYGGRVQYELRGGGHFHHEGDSPEMKSFGLPDKVILGEVLESDPPRKLVQTWHPQFTPEMTAEPPSRLTYESWRGKACVRSPSLMMSRVPRWSPAWCRAVAIRPRAAAAGRGSLAISSRCWKPAHACRPSPIAKLSLASTVLDAESCVYRSWYLRQTRSRAGKEIHHAAWSEHHKPVGRGPVGGDPLVH